MKKFQVTLSLGRTDTLDITSDSLIDVKGIYENLSDAKITMIKEYVFINSNPNENSFTQFYRELKILVGQTTLNLSRFVTVRFMKPFLTKDFIKNKCKQHLEINSKDVDYVHNIIRHG